MAQNLEGKVAVVTGSTTGIGTGIAHVLAGRGASVVLTGLGSEEESAKLLQEFKSQYKGTFHFVPGDLLDTEKTEKFAKDVLSIYPDGIDILMNNAGLASRGTIEDVSLETWLNSLAVNLTAPFILTKAFFPLMKKKGWGRIINMSSQLGLIGEPGKIAYCTPKTGLIGMSRKIFQDIKTLLLLLELLNEPSKVIALEGAAHGVTCNAICPGYVDAPMGHSMFAKNAAEKGISFEQAKDEFAQARSPMGRLIPISDVAELVAFLCSDAASFISGSALPIDSANTVR